MKGSKQRMSSISAFCDTCEKRTEARNAQAWAHQHARRTGHVVYFNAIYRVVPFREPSLFDRFEQERDAS